MLYLFNATWCWSLNNMTHRDDYQSVRAIRKEIIL